MEQWHGESSNLSREFVVKHVSSSVRGHSTAAGLLRKAETASAGGSPHTRRTHLFDKGLKHAGQDTYRLLQGLSDGQSALLLHSYSWEG